MVMILIDTHYLPRTYLLHTQLYMALLHYKLHDMHLFGGMPFGLELTFSFFTTISDWVRRSEQANDLYMDGTTRSVHYVLTDVESFVSCSVHEFRLIVHTRKYIFLG